MIVRTLLEELFKYYERPFAFVFLFGSVLEVDQLQEETLQRSNTFETSSKKILVLPYYIHDKISQ